MSLEIKKVSRGKYWLNLPDEDKTLLREKTSWIGQLLNFSEDDEWVIIPSGIIYEIQKEILEMLKTGS